MGEIRGWDRGSGNRLTAYDLHRFDGDTLLDRVARTVCRAGCLPRKELYEAWEVARRVRRRFRGGRVVEMACGHGLLAHLLLVLDDTSFGAVAVDRRVPESALRLAAVLEAEWPRLAGRLKFVSGDLEDVPLGAGDLVVSVHACGPLTDRVLSLASAARARSAVLPCCHDLDRADLGGLAGWMPGPLAVDATRSARLRTLGYRVFTQQIPEDITPQNRLLLAESVGDCRDELGPRPLLRASSSNPPR